MADQIRQVHRLICVFLGFNCHLFCFVMQKLLCKMRRLILNFLVERQEKYFLVRI